MPDGHTKSRIAVEQQVNSTILLLCYNYESTTGADASVEALKLYHMKLTLAYSSLLALASTKMGNDRRDRC